MRRRDFMLTMAAASAAPWSAPARADTFPSGPVKFVVPFSAGGPTDQIVRVISQPMSEVLGQPVIVDYKPGAGSRIATEFVVNSPPTGYTLLVNGLTGSLLPLLTSMPFDPQKELAPVTQLCSIPYVLLVRRDLPVKDIQAFIEYAKANPGKLNYGSASGTGSSTHFLLELFQDQTGTKAVMVPYKGSPQAAQDMMAGRIDFMFDTFGSAEPFIKDGRIRALAVTTPKRSELLPDLPTLIEAGLPKFDVSTWIGLMTPAKTPQNAIETLHKAATEVLRRPEVRKRLLELGTDVTLNAGAAQLAARRRGDVDTFGPLIERLGLTHKF
jgi:tripartite-type tricarboxylate transporter receptor subunit TctC